VPVTIRRADDDDMPGVAALRWRWIVDENAADEHVERSTFVDAFVAWAVDHRSSHHCVIAEDEGTLVGMAWLAIVDRVPSPRALGRRSGDVQSVYVVPERRGAGVGRQLIDALSSHADALGVERTVVHSSGGAVGFYEREGFASTERLRQRLSRP
jgi:ribosomal protein S18 acetylase RimI-like enzyme